MSCKCAKLALFPQKNGNWGEICIFRKEKKSRIYYGVFANCASISDFLGAGRFGAFGGGVSAPRSITFQPQ